MRNISKQRIVTIGTAALALAGVAAVAGAQTAPNAARIDARATNRPLASLKAAAVQARQSAPARASAPREVPNFVREITELPNRQFSDPDTTMQVTPGLAPTTISGGFPGASNDDNNAVLGIRIAPPDTDGTVGPNHFVQMINLLTTIYDKNGNVVMASAPSSTFWVGIGGNCEPNNRGDPIVLYDETADRWLVSQFAFNDAFSTFSQCVAISQNGDPTGGYNRYEFSFDGIGFNDYPKHGIVDGSITMMANLFQPPAFAFTGTYLGVMDKAAMYAGQPASLLGFNLGAAEFGFVAADLDGPGSVPALFGTAMSTAGAFDVWQIDVDWTTENASVNQIASIPISPFDNDLCNAAREACIPQPGGGPALEAIADRLMHRLQLRDFGSYRTMVTAHTVDVGGGRAGIRWYEFRESTGTWSLFQEGTFGPNDGENRWMPSIAMNAAGDIGAGYLLASANTFVSTAVAGQSAGNSGSGQFDSEEVLCAPGSGVQLGTARAGDYSSTTIDPTTGDFWHTNEVFNTTGQFEWATFVCSFSVQSGSTGDNYEFGTAVQGQANSTTFNSVALNAGLGTPIVVMGPPSFNGGQPGNIRVNNVSSASFQFQFDEWDYLDGGHVAENFGWLAMNAGQQSFGSLDATAGQVTVNDAWTTVTFATPFSSAPVVVAQIATFNGPQSATTRIRNVTATSFEVRLQEEQGNDGTHANETVHYVAIETGTADVNGDRIVVGRTTNSVTQNFATINFGSAVQAPTFLAQMQTFDGPDPADLRHQNLTATGVQVKVEEEQSADAEVGHTTEVVGWIVLGNP